MKAHTILLWSALAGVACDDDDCWEDGREVKPRLGLALPHAVASQTHQDTEAKGTACRDEPACTGVAGLCAGDTFVVIHEIAQQVGDTPYPLKLTITTACAEEAVETRHFDGLVVRPMTAPACADQGMVVTAEIANSRESCTVPPIVTSTCETEETDSE